jgi:hypothetical protein
LASSAGSAPPQAQQQHLPPQLPMQFVVMLEHGGLPVGELLGEITICTQPRARFA